MRQPDRETIQALCERVEAVTGKQTPDRLEADILRAFGLLGERSWLIGSRIDQSLRFLAIVLPGWGYRITRGPVPMDQDHIVTTLLRPAQNPDGSVTDGGSWSQEFPAVGPSEAVSMLRAIMIALRDRDATPAA